MWRCLAALLLIALEVLVVTLRFDSGSEVIAQTPYVFYSSLYYAGKLLRYLISVVGVLFILSLARRKQVLAVIDTQLPHSNFWRYLFLQLVASVIFYLLSLSLLEDIPSNTTLNSLWVNAVGIAWLLTGFLAGIACLLMMARPSFWFIVVKSQYKVLLGAAIAGLLSMQTGFLAKEAWEPLLKTTFNLAQFILGVFYPQIVADTERAILGTPAFQVEISAACSGYEGMGLITAFLSLYVWMFRKQLRFPRTFCLFPFSILAMWLLNVLRIVVLVVIGDKISPAIAVSGFHSTAGWILFVSLSVLVIVVCQKVPYFINQESELVVERQYSPDKAMALLMPFVVLLASILIAMAFSSGFDWLYPLKVLISAAVLWYFRDVYRKYSLDVSYQSVLIGLFVFVLWWMLVPFSASDDEKFAMVLFAQPEQIGYTWLLFRFLGATITVPIIEELAFRGYVITKLVDQNFEKVTPGQFTWLSLLGSSFLFGILHGQWLAGFLAGICYALALYRRGQLVDAVIAHLVTNLALAIYVVATQHWSLW
ncbi:exosortase E/protease, VPEID-CTERM system [Methylomonas sp. AM2-LC]|uniref:exosortase E/protease, VPEID-CTERM system n=1 Tax=Methylomonas sp. AM2-LC TaxID=3153301 RepID=UPI003265EE64